MANPRQLQLKADDSGRSIWSRAAGAMGGAIRGVVGRGVEAIRGGVESLRGAGVRAVADIGRAVRAVATRVAETLLLAVVQAIRRWVESSVEDARAAVDRVVEFVGQLATKVLGAILRVGRWITNLPVRLQRLFVGLLEGLLSLRPWSLQWWASLVEVETWKGLLAWLGLRVVELAEVLGVPEILETVADFIKFSTRPLAGDEIAAARRVFGDSINYALVRVDEGAIVGNGVEARLGWLRNVPIIGLPIEALIGSDLSGTAAYVSFHTINTWGPMDHSLLLHELTHVWQYEQMGAVYIPLALHAQATGGYRYRGVAGLEQAREEGKRFTEFNLEQQGDIVRDFYRLSVGDPVRDANRDDHLCLYAHFIQEVSTHSLAHLTRGASCATPEPA